MMGWSFSVQIAGREALYQQEHDVLSGKANLGIDLIIKLSYSDSFCRAKQLNITNLILFTLIPTLLPWSLIP